MLEAPEAPKAWFGALEAWLEVTEAWLEVSEAESIFLHTPTYRVTFLAGETSRVSQGNTRGVSRRRRRRRKRRRKRKRKRRRNKRNDLLAWSREEGCVVDTDRKRESHRQTERG